MYIATTENYQGKGNTLDEAYNNLLGYYGPTLHEHEVLFYEAKEIKVKRKFEIKGD